MQEHTNTPQRRATDLTANGTQPTIIDVWRLTCEIRDRVANIERQQLDQTEAFVENDIHKPDYDGHRKDHIKLKKQEEIMASYKSDMTKRILGIIITFVIGLITTGLVSKMSDHIK